MDYIAAINRVYDHLENDDVDKAVMTCLRIARNLQDYLYAAIFLRELYPVRRDFLRVLYDDTSNLTEEAQKHLDKTSLEYWIDTHTLPYSLAVERYCQMLWIEFRTLRLLPMPLPVILRR
jgi:hypothetical protein